MTRQEQAAAKLQQAQAALKRTELEGKVAAVEASIEAAEHRMAEAKDQHSRDAAQKDLDVAKAAKRCMVEALIAHDEQCERKPARIEFGFEGDVPSRAQAENYIRMLELRKARVELEISAFKLESELKVMSYCADRIPELDAIEGKLQAAKAWMQGGKGA